MIAACRSGDESVEDDAMTEERTVVEHSGSLYANLTKAARMCVGFDKGDQIRIQTFNEGVWIERIPPEVDDE